MSRVDAELDPLTVRAQARVGQRIRDKWRLDALLGVGGMAAVYAATHRNGKRVAMKILHREVALSDDARARFTREGYVANAVGHKGAVSVIDDDVTEDGAPYFTMDLLDGETLDQRVRRKGRLGVEEVLAATFQLLDVLAAAHDKGIVHRDIKPENVFLTKDAAIKVLDFGIAHLHEQVSTEALSGATQDGHTMGTPSFMPPEQARGRWDEVDPRSDVWAVGATMFTLLTGRHVHEADTMNEVLLGAMSVPAKPIALYRPELPGAVSEVVDRALAFAMDDRWQSAKEMQGAVREAYRAMKQSIEDLGREPTLMATSVNTPNFAAPPVPATKRATVTTARPTTHTAPDDTQARLAQASRRNKIGIVAGGAIGVLLAFAVMFVKNAGPGAPTAAAASPSDPSSNVITETPSAEPMPAPPSTGAAMPLPPATEKAPAANVQPIAVVANRPRARKAPPVVAPSQPVAAPVTPAPAPAPADPLTRRH
jgi:serine/threonine-protein kinase